VVWNRGPLAALSHHGLDDPRVRVHYGDVGALMRAARATYDAILLDVDNGPEAVTREANDDLYQPAGLHAAWNALRPGGVLAVWSAARDPAFTRRLRQTGFETEEVAVRANGKRGARHLIWVAVRPESGARLHR
jgi:spermidine synthase